MAGDPKSRVRTILRIGGNQWAVGVLSDRGRLSVVLECVPNKSLLVTNPLAEYTIIRMVHDVSGAFRIFEGQGKGEPLGKVNRSMDLKHQAPLDTLSFIVWDRTYPMCRVPFRAKVSFRDLLSVVSSCQFREENFKL